MKGRRWALRCGPWLLSAAVVLIGMQVSEYLAARAQVDEPVAFYPASLHPGFEATEASPPTETCLALAALSEQAAALTGSLAFVEKQYRPAQAAVAAQEVRALARRAAGIEDGETLAGTLTDLAESLESYATGPRLARSTALAAAREASFNAIVAASARNAALREAYTYHCGGKP